MPRSEKAQNSRKIQSTTKNPDSAPHVSAGSSGQVRTAKPLPRAFFDRDPRVVAAELLGKLLVRRHGERILAGRIVETEAYLGLDDPAAHAYVGRTDRNAVMFGPPGFAYVYFIYGAHYCLNVSCWPDEVPGAILFRALEPVAGFADMARFRHVHLSPEPRLSELKLLTSGPGRLAQALAVTRVRDNNKDLTSNRRSDLWLADDGHTVEQVLKTPRIGITKAADDLYRFIVAGSPFVSGKRFPGV